MTFELDAREVRAAYHALARFTRERAIAGRGCPLAVVNLYRRLDAATRCPDAASPTRHQNEGGPAQSETWIGTRLACQVLGWGSRRVQRHAADLDGQLVGGRLVFPARTVHEYARAIGRQPET